MEKWKVGVVVGVAAVTLIAVMMVIQSRSTGSGQSGWPTAKPITFVIPFAPGGGFDEYVRKISPLLEEELGTPVVPENIAGAGGRIGVNTVYRAPPDGYTIGIWNIPGMGITPLLGEDVQYDIEQVTWLAQLSSETYAIAVNPDSSIESFEDLCNLGRPASLSAQGGLSSTATLTSIMSMAMANCPYKLVTGYQGSAQATLAVMRGDVDARISPIGSLMPFVESGDARFILTFERERSLEDVPASSELGYEEFSNFDLRRLIGGPPGIPEEIRQRLSRAIINVANSRNMQEWSQNTNRPLNTLNADETEAAMERIMAFYRQYSGLMSEEVAKFEN